MQFPETLKSVMNERHLTNNKVAQYANVSEGAVRSWIKDGKTPSIAAIIPLCDNLNLSVDWMLTGRERGNGSVSVSGSVSGNTIVGTNNGSFVVRNGVERVLENETADLLHIFDSLSKKQRFKLLSVAYSLASENDDNGVVE